MRALVTSSLWLVTLGAAPPPPGPAGHVFYVSTTGKRGADGTEHAPFASLGEAAARARAGDIIRVAAGTYREGRTIRLEARGTDKQPVRVEAADLERPVLDFAEQPEDEKGSRGLELSGDYWQLVGIEVAHAGSYGILITGSHNLLHRCVARENRNTGIQLDARASYNLVASCDSYRNFDPETSGENADGFAAKHAVGPGNVFRGCRSYQNADDGFDLWMAPYPIVIEDCIAFRNGYNLWGVEDFQGDGNGFKLGGNYIDAQHQVRRSVAIENPLNGFDQNHNLGGLTIEDSVAIRCGRGFTLPETARRGRNLLRGNASFGCQNVLEPHVVAVGNHWYPDIAVGNLGPPPRPGHRNVAGAGPEPASPEAPLLTPGPAHLAPPPDPLKYLIPVTPTGE
jgi:hypothetical protein